MTPGQKSILRDPASGSFIGFSWGPVLDAFKADGQSPNARPIQPSTPLVSRVPFTPIGKRSASVQATPQRFMTPIRPNLGTPFSSAPGTIGRTAQRRTVSDREAFKQLVSCVGMSARKKVLESGRKPRLLTLTTASSGRSRASTLKELRFDRSVAVLGADTGISYRLDPTSTSSSAAGTSSFATLSYLSIPPPGPLIPSESDSSMDSEALYSPSPSPRPSSAMSSLSKHSMTPASLSLRPRSVSNPSTLDSRTTLSSAVGSRGFLSPISPLDPPWAENPAFRARPPPPIVSMNKSLTYDVLDEFQLRYDRLMQDIEGISGRLGEVALRMNG